MNDKSRMKGDFHVRFREKFEVKVLLLTRLRGRNFSREIPPTRLLYTGWVRVTKRRSELDEMSEM